MRILKFIVEGSTLKQDPSCNFKGLFPGANQPIQAEFSFSEDWIGIPKVVGFYSMLDNEYPPQLIDENNRCMIPPEALERTAFKLKVLGRKHKTITPTNTITVYQKGDPV